MDSLKIVKMQRDRIIKDLLPDRCQVFPKSGSNRTIEGGVIRSDAPEARVWRTINAVEIVDVPCRSDLSRAFRPDKLKVQATEVDEFNLELPYDMIVEPTDLIHLTNPNTNEIEIFEVRKRKNISAFDATIECVIAVPGVVTDAHS